MRKYPWGNDWDPSRCASWETDIKIFQSEPKYIDMFDGWGTLPVGSFPKGVSPYGLMDVVGNVWEWCNDWYDKDFYKNSPDRNPIGPSTGARRVFRGGSWIYLPWFLRCSTRHWLSPTPQAFPRLSCGVFPVMFFWESDKLKIGAGMSEISPRSFKN